MRIINGDLDWDTENEHLVLELGPSDDSIGARALRRVERDGVTLPGDRCYGVDYFLAGAPD